MTTRRAFMALVGALALTTRGPALGQQAKVRQVGILFAGIAATPPQADANFAAFLEGMRSHGYVEGRNIRYLWRASGSNFDTLPGLAAELAALGVDVILTPSTPAARAARQATRTIPIVVVSVGDPVGTGLAASLARPGGNLTGMSNLSVDLGPKRLDFLAAVVAGLTHVAVMLNPRNPTYPLHAKEMRAAAAQAGMRLLIADASSMEEIETAFATVRRERAQAVVVQHDALYVQQREQIARLAVTARIPAIFGSGEYVAAGGLMSYGHDPLHNYRHVAIYVDKILKGAKPAELPIEQPSRLEFAVNLEAARRIGLKFPASLLQRADRVIE